MFYGLTLEDMKQTHLKRFKTHNETNLFNKNIKLTFKIKIYKLVLYYINPQKQKQKFLFRTTKHNSFL